MSINRRMQLVKNTSFALLTLALAVGLTGCSRQAKQKRHLERANAYFDNGEYQKAEIEYLNAAQLGTLDPNIVNRLGTIFYEQGRLHEALPLLQKNKELNGDDLDNRYRLGSAFLSLRYLTGARQEALFILGKQPTNAPAILLLTDAANSPDQAATVRQKISELIRNGANTWAAHAALAQLALRENKLAEAETEAQTAAQMNAAAPEVNVILAELASSRRQTNQVEAFLRAAMDNSPPRSPLKLQLARLKIQSRDNAAAKELLAKITQKTPDYVPALALRGQIALAEGDFAESDRIANSVLSWNPRNYDIRLLRTRSLLLQQKSSEALQEFTRLEALFPNSPELKFEKAGAHLQNGAVDDAIKSLDEALRINPGFSQAVLLRAELKLRTGHPDEAIAALVLLTKANPKEVRARLTLASAYLAQKQLDQALALYRGLAAEFPTVPEFPALAGAVLAQQQRFNEARTSLEAALKLAPLYIAAAEQLTEIDVSQKNFPAAQQRVKELLALHTNSAPALLLSAKVALATKDTNAAVAALRQVIEKKPEASAPYALLGQIMISSGNRDSAMNELKKAVERNPKDVGSHLLLGMLYETSTDYAGARKQYETILKLNPKLALAWNNLAYVLSERFNEHDAAMTAAAKARELEPKDSYIADTLGWVYFRKKQYPQALALFRESSVGLMTVADVFYHLAHAEYVMGLEAEARASFQKAIDLKLGRKEAEDATRRLVVLSTPVNGGTKSLEFLQEAVKSDPDDFMAAFRMGEVHEASGSFDKAQAAFERAARLNPLLTRPLIRQAALYAEKLNNLPKAVELAKAARNLSPNDASVASLLGRLSYRVNDYVGAAALLQEVLRDASADVDLLYELALCYYCLGQFDQARSALNDYSKRPRASKHLADARDVLTLMDYYVGKADPKLAEKTASARLAREPVDIPSLMTLGLLLDASGKFQDAVSRYERILVLNPSFAPAQRQLAIIYSDALPNEAKAIDLATKARKVFEKDPALDKALGKSAYRSGDYQLAVNSLSRLTADPEGQLMLGLSYDKLNRRTEATNILMRLASGTNAAIAQQARLALQNPGR